ncbi:MAG: PDZ domain-containing protein [Gemmatimonadota bacterium]|nr:MAG: PDZ domain-containing protein [Gemmatimonadota bacterium]
MMSIPHVTLNVAAAMLAAGVLSSFAAAQQAASCKEGEIAVASLGYSKLECNCTIGHIEGEPSRTVYEFRSEPRIWEIEDGGPADGKLKEGDVVTAIDGHLITTAEGGNRFGALIAGEPVSLTVRRDGRELDVTITPVAECKSVEHLRRPVKPALTPKPVVALTVKTSPRVAVVPAPGTPVEAARLRAVLPRPAPEHAILPRGWLGFSLSCTDCKVGKSEEGWIWWEFSDYPEITRVESGSPAHEAGMRAGDVLTHIDDYDLTDEKGGRLFGGVEPGDTVRFRYVRQGNERTVTLTAGERELRLAEPIVPSPKRSPQPGVKRFSGVFGDAFVEVTGAPIVVNRSGDELVISSEDITVRIRRAGGEGPR